MAVEIAPNWYPDPTLPATERYWDGTKWTDHTRASGPQPPQTAPQYNVAPTPEKGGMGTALKVLLVLMVVGLGGCLALVASVGNNIEVRVDELARNEELVQDSATITECGITELRWGKAVVEFTNPFEEERGFISVEINFLSNDVVVGSAVVVFENLSPGQKAIGEAIAFDLVRDTTAVSCEIVDGAVL
ncbi:MAG: DUF2510 domain-containing protein [Acidimicrobiales bacterium]